MAFLGEKGNEMKELLCRLDGNALCIHTEDFINLQESEAVFIELNPEQMTEILSLQVCNHVFSGKPVPHCVKCGKPDYNFNPSSRSSI